MPLGSSGAVYVPSGALDFRVLLEEIEGAGFDWRDPRTGMALLLDEMSDEHTLTLDELAISFQQKQHVATTLWLGPHEDVFCSVHAAAGVTEVYMGLDLDPERQRYVGRFLYQYFLRRATPAIGGLVLDPRALADADWPAIFGGREPVDDLEVLPDVLGLPLSLSGNIASERFIQIATVDDFLIVQRDDAKLRIL
jgi:hypothetical protein